MLDGKIFGLTYALLISIAIALYIGKKYGASIPILKSIP